MSRIGTRDLKVNLFWSDRGQAEAFAFKNNSVSNQPGQLEQGQRKYSARLTLSQAIVLLPEILSTTRKDLAGFQG